MAEIGQQRGKLPVSLELAFEQHAVEVEDNGVEQQPGGLMSFDAIVEPQHQSSNSALPMRTAVAPSITAVG